MRKFFINYFITRETLILLLDTSIYVVNVELIGSCSFFVLFSITGGVSQMFLHCKCTKTNVRNFFFIHWVSLHDERLRCMRTGAKALFNSRGILSLHIPRESCTGAAYLHLLLYKRNYFLDLIENHISLCIYIYTEVGKPRE